MNPRSHPGQVEEGRIAVIRLEGELGLEELADVGAELFRQVARGRVRLVLDLSAVPHLDYRGVRPLVARTELLRRGGGDVKLVGVSSYLAAVLRVGGAYGAFEHHLTVASAEAAFLQPMAHVA